MNTSSAAPGDVAGVEPRLQRRLVDQPAACAVDDAHALLRLGQVLRRQDVAGLVSQWRVQRDEIGTGQQLIELDLLDAEFDAALGREEGIIGDHLHLQAARPLGDDRADIARPDQPQRLGRELHAHEAVLLPLARLGGRVGLGQLAGKREHQRDGVLGGGDGIAERRVHHHHTLRGRGRNINIVDADAGAADHLQVRGSVQDVARDLGRGADREAVIAADDLLELVGLEPGDLVHLDPAFAEDLGGLGIHFVGDETLSMIESPTPAKAGVQ
jgi:hypothetical protein